MAEETESITPAWSKLSVITMDGGSSDMSSRLVMPDGGSFISIVEDAVDAVEDVDSVR